LENYIPIGQDYGLPPAAQALQSVERARIQPIGERVVYQIGLHSEQANIRRMLHPVTLQSSEIITVTQLRHQFFEDHPIPVTRLWAVLALKVIPQVILYVVIVEQSIIDIDQEHD
jgi:hypothetical protein